MTTSEVTKYCRKKAQENKHQEKHSENIWRVLSAPSTLVKAVRRRVVTLAYRQLVKMNDRRPTEWEEGGKDNTFGGSSQRNLAYSYFLNPHLMSIIQVFFFLNILKNHK